MTDADRSANPGTPLDPGPAGFIAFGVDRDLDVVCVLNATHPVPDPTTIADIVGEAMAPEVRAAVRTAFSSDEDQIMRVQWPALDPGLCANVRVALQRDADEHAAGALVCIVREPDDARIARDVLSLTDLGTWQYSASRDEFTFSDDFYDVIGWTAAEFGGHDVPAADYAQRVIHPSEVDVVRAGILRVMASDPSQHHLLRHRFCRSDGSEGMLEVRVRVVHDAAGRPVGMVGANRVVGAGDEDGVLNATLANRLESAVNAAAIGVWEVRFPGEGVMCNAHFLMHRGIPADEQGTWGSTLTAALAMVVPDDRERVREVVEGTAIGGSFSLEYDIRARDGRVITLSTTGTVEPQPGASGGRVVYAAESDVSALRASERINDPLTGVANRAGVLRYVASCRDEEGGTDSLIVGVLDIRGFAALNDAFGYEVGDRVLQDVARALREAAPPEGMVGRLAGDTFVVVFTGVSREEAGGAVEVMRQAIEQTPLTVVEGFGSLRVIVRAGITRVPAASGRGLAVDDERVLRAIDGCLRLSKKSSARVVTFDLPEDDRAPTAVAQRLRWAGAVSRALDDDRLKLVAQPIVRLGTRDVEAYELLLRLDDGTRMVAAGEFMPAVTALGMGAVVDRFVLESGVALAARFQAELGGARLFMNMTPGTITDPGFPDRLVELAEVHGVALTQLGIEMVETEVVADLDALRANVRAMRRNGVFFVIDDFGSGASGPDYLRELEVDILKLDGRFTLGCRSSGVDRAVVAGASAIADALEVPLVAEWIEDAQLMEELQSLGVTLGQGFSVGRPEPLEGYVPAA